MTDGEANHARLVGVNHVALEVGDIDAALDFYGSLFDFELRGRSETKAFLDMGDQFLALTVVDGPYSRDEYRHFGLVVDDPNAVERRLDALDVERRPTDGLDFHDPWGNWIQIVAYAEIQFTKADHVLDGMGITEVEKTAAAREELAEKGLAPASDSDS